MIVTYGDPISYDSQCPDHNHKYAAKNPGRRSQKQILLLNLNIKLQQELAKL